MATRWTNRVNPVSWFTQRRARTAPVAPGGRKEFATPAEYVPTAQDDYSAADRPTQDSTLEWFAESAGSSAEFRATSVISHPVSMNDWRPRTLRLEYDADSERLRVTYRDNVTYEYEYFDQAKWDSLSREGNSTGKWLDTNLLSVNSGSRV